VQLAAKYEETQSSQNAARAPANPGQPAPDRRSCFHGCLPRPIAVDDLAGRAEGARVAESSGKAFGRYLRMLRERRGLSLDDVRSLSQTFPETITKSYISRCENGYHKLALAKLIPLSRIYEVPADAVLERMELDLELDRLGGPDTEGKSFAELFDSSKRMCERGCRWEAYAYSRDALTRSATSPVQDRYRDLLEQQALAVLNVGTMAAAVGRFRFALHESLFALNTGHLTATSYARACDRVADVQSKLGQLDLAGRFVEQAISTATASNDRLGLAFMYSTQARIALARLDHAAAAELFHKSHALHKDFGHLEWSVLALLSVAECYLDLKRVQAAHRLCQTAASLLQDHPRSSAYAATLAIEGKVADAEGKRDRATALWHEAATLARNHHDRAMRFKIDLCLFRRAISDKDSAAARAIQRRLRRLAPWIPTETPELAEYFDLIRGEKPPGTTYVAGWQRSELPLNN
jgi:tetratricopeptide (TPR) repeat protein